VKKREEKSRKDLAKSGFSCKIKVVQRMRTAIALFFCSYQVQEEMVRWTLPE